MATEALSSTEISNRDASPKVPNASITDRGVPMESAGYATITSGMTSGSTYRLVTVPADARISQILLNNPALSASTAFDLGVYKTTADGAAVVDQDFFATAVACTSANTQLDVTNESGTYTVDKQSQPLWQAVGLTAAPASGALDIVLTNTATNAAGGLVGLKVRFVR